MNKYIGVNLTFKNTLLVELTSQPEMK